MRRFINDTRGAVTVFVTLLLIPAMLISGTAVDLARIHTARSILQDANQLAANSVLTQYDALLYDIYGLMGVAQDDPILDRLLDEYIRVSVFGEEPRDTSLGTLQLFYGSGLSMEDLQFADGKSLGNPDVLRRQIEEYMKFRAPVIIVQEFLEALGKNSLKEDVSVIEDKLEIDSSLADLYDKYKELYNAIIAADKCILPIGGISGGSFGTVSSTLQIIRGLFVELKVCYSDWQSAGTGEEKADYASKYNGILSNIKSFTVGGARCNNWVSGFWTTTYSYAPAGPENPENPPEMPESSEFWTPGYWRSHTSVIGLDTHIANAKKQADNFKPKFDAVLKIAGEIDAMNAELSRKVDELETKLRTGECNEELKKSLIIEKSGTPAMTVIERYRYVLQWNNITYMATVYKNGGNNYIDEVHKPMLDGVKYRNVNNESAGSLSQEQLSSLSSDPGFRLSSSVPVSSSKVAVFAGFPEDSVTYKMAPGFLKFAEHPGENSEFFDALTKMMQQSAGGPVKLYDGQKQEGGSDAEAKQRGNINALLKMINEAYIGLTNQPLGAMYINDAGTHAPEKPGILDVIKLIPEALSNPIISAISDPLGTLGGAGDYILLLTYCSQVFSNYTTSRPQCNDKTKETLDEIVFSKSITGVPISPCVNYFFQSEWEYLYNGGQNAGANLSAITRLLFLVRLVCNYITVFSVPEVTSIVTGIQAAFAWSPPLGVILGELARAAFAVAESLVDVGELRSGHKVPLFKSAPKGEWVCSPSGVTNAIKKVSSGQQDAGEKSGEERGFTYSQYMILFFISKSVTYFGPGSPATELAGRTGDLIEWNIINYNGSVNGDEGKMAGALGNPGRFRLSGMQTGFCITTTVTLRMLFLSMPFAAKGIGGVVPPATLPITVTDYRGY